MRHNISSIRRYTRDSKIFGVCSGIAIWADLDINKFRLIAFLVVLFTGFFPGAFIYLILSIIIPSADYDDSYYSRTSSYESPYADEDDRSNDDLRNEYEKLKRKVEDMESSLFDKEKDWDQRFNEK